ncbi:MAG TPA: peptidyl-prolyl cis-trans isomerase [Sedimentisphaerales bacterium]|nr:peptidyl-prolyl cis-trans isomerase [Phycisphaerae bacterium]HON93497.1 peptidyl-prolyl cis-trans isomerase [Sedimentisphaerales bacterium]HQI27231.1 peptidyl-prolyl cis-trans isomerase [Sedimentisphaerales bacterium]
MTVRRMGQMGVKCLFALVLVLPTGCEGNKKKSALTEEEIRQKTYAPRPIRPDEILISGETITFDDVLISPPEEDISGPSLRDRLEARAKEVSLEQFLAEARPVIEQRLNRNIITRIVLAKRARRELGDKADDALDKMAEKELRRFIMEEHGGNGAEADAALQRRGMNRTTFKERRKRDFLAQYVIDSAYRRNRPVTYREIVAHYDKVKDQEFCREGVLQLRLIDIDVAKVPLEDPNEDRLHRARLLGADLRMRIEAGEDFGELAKQYSNDPLASQGGLLRPRNPNAFAPPYDVLAAKAKNMRVGQVAGPLDAPGRVFLMKVEAKQDEGYLPLSEVQDRVREEILRERRRTALDELEKEIGRQVAQIDTAPFVDYCLERFYRLVRAER